MALYPRIRAPANERSAPPSGGAPNPYSFPLAPGPDPEATCETERKAVSRSALRERAIDLGAKCRKRLRSNDDPTVDEERRRALHVEPIRFGAVGVERGVELRAVECATKSA